MTELGHFTIRDSEPAWGSVDKSALPVEAFAYPYVLPASQRNDIPKSEWKLPHHFRASDGTLFAHRRGVQLALQAMGAGIRGNRVQLPRGSVAAVRAHLNRHLAAIRRREEALIDLCVKCLDSSAKPSL